ncbi:hypothetical protein niasHT_004401 [Heterodera trifolii]|uniref:Uncharacterized protein n=1 Tax=Heterodera trifolii TaxID=157864 RepID=A0ABD2LNI9_9BILA
MTSSSFPIRCRIFHQNLDIVPHLPSCRKDIVPHLPPCSTTAKRNNGDIGGIMDEENKPCDPNSNGIAYHHGTEIW